MNMLTCLKPLSIVMKRVKGLIVEHGFMESEEFEDIGYRWDIRESQCNGISQFFTMALYEALQYRTEQLLEAQASSTP
jgi:hypothetical protein